MSNLEVRLNNLSEIIQKAAPDFAKLAKIHGAVHFEREASFAFQLLKDNDYLAEVAAGNPDSLKYAILNVASVGLSLNPVTKEAYLVPRKVNGKKKICFDPAWRGLLKQAVDSGSIEWASAEVVFEKDEFAVGQAGKPPFHKFDPFSDRGAEVGAYCVAKLPGGDYMTTTMAIPEIKAIAERSEAYQKNVGPWFSDRQEMMKKTVVRRAAKMWPAGKNENLSRALALDEEVNLTAKDVTPVPKHQRSHNIESLLETLKGSGRSETQLMDYAKKKFRREIETLEQFTDLEITQLLAFLKSVKPIEKKVIA